MPRRASWTALWKLTSKTRVPRSWRIFLGGLLIAKWLVPALRCLTFPVAVNRQRFLVALCVLSLYIVVFYFVRGCSTAKYDLLFTNRTAECNDKESTFQGRIGSGIEGILQTFSRSTRSRLWPGMLLCGGSRLTILDTVFATLVFDRRRQEPPGIGFQAESVTRNTNEAGASG